ncbi:MAG: hypothetical protein JSS72_08680 [Armatimonadetes bacterium]|nr:hypothetical protein [Armatimonadota bacterium]
MEGFWTCTFEGIQGFGTGVVVLIGGKLFGGDTGYTYTGSYTVSGSTLEAKVHVEQYVGGIPSVMGQTNFNLELRGAANGNQIVIAGSVPGTPMLFRGTMTKRSELPARNQAVVGQAG